MSVNKQGWRPPGWAIVIVVVGVLSFTIEFFLWGTPPDLPWHSCHIGLPNGGELIYKCQTTGNPGEWYTQAYVEWNTPVGRGSSSPYGLLPDLPDVAECWLREDGGGAWIIRYDVREQPEMPWFEIAVDFATGKVWYCADMIWPDYELVFEYLPDWVDLSTGTRLPELQLSKCRSPAHETRR